MNDEYVGVRNPVGEPLHTCYCVTRQGETWGQFSRASRAHSVVWSSWQVVQGLGIPYLSVNAGEMNLKVWLRTLTLLTVLAIGGM